MCWNSPIRRTTDGIAIATTPELPDRRATMLLMPELNARPVDPRDTRWEVWSPAYRIFLWSRSNEAWASREFEIGAADVDDVLDWIREQSDAEMFTLYATVDRGDDLGLVRLAGTDPTRST